jgi:hypothetical protein
MRASSILLDTANNPLTLPIQVFEIRQFQCVDLDNHGIILTGRSAIANTIGVEFLPGTILYFDQSDIQLNEVKLPIEDPVVSIEDTSSLQARQINN